MCMKAEERRYASDLGRLLDAGVRDYFLLLWGSLRRWWDGKDRRRDENPSGSGRLARVCLLARLYPGSGQLIHGTFLMTFFLLSSC